jgi:hypothetical protein
VSKLNVSASVQPSQQPSKGPWAAGNADRLDQAFTAKHPAVLLKGPKYIAKQYPSEKPRPLPSRETRNTAFAQQPHSGLIDRET